LSQSGLCLRVGPAVQVERGVRLRLELHNLATGFACAVRARVVHVQLKPPSARPVGCVLDQPLSDNDIDRLV
jgi:hypothetical protein